MDMEIISLAGDGPKEIYDWDPRIGNHVDYGPHGNAYCHPTSSKKYVDSNLVMWLKAPKMVSNDFFKSYTSIENTNYIAANYHCSTFYTYSDGQSGLTNDKQFNYVLQDVEEATLREIHSVSANQHGNEFSINGENKLTWYGRTSEPIWESTTFTPGHSEKMNYSQQGYFRPESIKLLPLIKL